MRRLKWNLHRKRSDNEFDWRSQGVVSSIRNQGGCGSCYAFATTAVIESFYAIQTDSQKFIDFSPQQVVDCSSNGNYGCNGGDFGPTFNYLLEQGGKIATEDSYPYIGTDEACKIDGVDQIDLGNLGAGFIDDEDEEELAEALVNYEPMYVHKSLDSKRLMFAHILEQCDPEF